MEAAVKGPGWGVPDEVLRLLPGPAFEVQQTNDENGLPVEKPVVESRKPEGLLSSLHHSTKTFILLAIVYTFTMSFP